MEPRRLLFVFIFFSTALLYLFCITFYCNHYCPFLIKISPHLAIWDTFLTQIGQGLYNILVLFCIGRRIHRKSAYNRDAFKLFSNCICHIMVIMHCYYRTSSFNGICASKVRKTEHKATKITQLRGFIRIGDHLTRQARKCISSRQHF